MIMLLGHGISTLLGAAIGVLSKNQMMATSLTVPVMMVLAFLPMMSMFNETIKKVAKYIFSEQLFLLINSLSDFRIETENIIILACNAVIIFFVFGAAYRKNVMNP